MKKVFFTGCALLALVCCISLPGLKAADAPADDLRMKKTRKSVLFKHSVHARAGVECTVCHHTWDGSSEVKKCSAPDCHDVFDRKNRTAQSYYRVIHNKRSPRTNCLSCHKAVAGKDSALRKKMTSCSMSACHPPARPGKKQ